MSDPTHQAEGERRARARRKTDPAPKAASGQEAANSAYALPVPVPPAAKPDDANPTLSAHLLGQTGQKRGLRGGPETLTKARAAYLTAEWSGPTDRRTRTGLISKTEI